MSSEQLSVTSFQLPDARLAVTNYQLPYGRTASCAPLPITNYRKKDVAALRLYQLLGALCVLPNDSGNGNPDV